jgi:hypothetical protein
MKEHGRGLFRVPLEERVRQHEIGFDATPGDVHEAEGTRLRLQGVNLLWWEAGHCRKQSVTEGETMSTQAAGHHEKAAHHAHTARGHHEQATCVSSGQIPCRTSRQEIALLGQGAGV